MEYKPLFESENPLTERLGEAFFDELPKVPGIYKMYGSAGRLLYVGKAKNLRSRLLTYRRARPGRESRKVIRLVRMIHALELEEHPSEEEALLRENELIRDHKPEFNHAKKQHEAYYYLVFREKTSKIITDLRMHVREDEKEYTFGAFKGHVTVRRGLGGLLRQLYIIEHNITKPFELPSQLLKKLTPLHYELSIDKLTGSDWMDSVRLFLGGDDSALLFKIMEHAREQKLLESFIGKVILKDMEALKFFFDCCCRRNFEINEILNLDSALIPQEKLDDYLVQWAFARDD
ncbi:GIY-YIG nuclease family protein [Balneolaceae bacterium YR4-1]|uniref:GIY-YIG nuclease family protein n=1 Tax=Halalkalibaculum roseum TaxID=2709311 RepID=A0A6M1T512_9BACT|nr:GIY-YIG nuclease family protein [Halalkalibaculum roseum]NGP75433.1 GIY-YIG nuclease family protein [Halalkalibaculum roseum]